MYDFAYVHNIDDRLEELAALAEDEDWEYKHLPPEHSKPILYYYFHYTYELGMELKTNKEMLKKEEITL